MSLRLSWSRLGNFQTCPRRYYLGDVLKWTKKITKEKRALLLGIAVHSGIETAMWYMTVNPLTAANRPETLIVEAAEGVRAYISELRQEIDEQYGFDLTTGKPFGDSPEFVALLDDIQTVALKIVEYQIPRLGLGTDYVPVKVSDLFSKEVAKELGLPYDRPAIEMHFVANGPDYTLSGIVDAVVRDVHSGQLILIDWKVRRSFTSQNSVLIDHQLALYAAILNRNIAVSGKTDVIKVVRQVQLKAGDEHGNGAVPRAAKINKDGTPSLAQNQNSTWEVWSASLRSMGINPDKYLDQMYDKLKRPEHYIVVENYEITPAVIEDLTAYANVWAQIIAATTVFPGVYKTHACQYCPFQRVCIAQKFGGPEEAQAVLDEHFVKGIDNDAEALYTDDIE